MHCIVRDEAKVIIFRLFSEHFMRFGLVFGQLEVCTKKNYFEGFLIFLVQIRLQKQNQLCLVLLEIPHRATFV